MLRAENHKLELGDHELNSWPIDFAVQAASPPNAAMGATAAAAPITEPTGTPGTLSAASTAAVMTPATAVGGAATIMAGQPRPSQHAAASQLDLGRVWRDSFKPPDADGRTERCDRGKPGSGPGTCELLYPWPDIPAVMTAAALPRFSSTCLRQFHDRSGSVMAETPAARPQLRQVPTPKTNNNKTLHTQFLAGGRDGLVGGQAGNLRSLIQITFFLTSYPPPPARI